ncbi:hypothetical protein HFN89_03705 [Rhizobium laguerreae]|nr:hypothetical protein [Rhizobium laguerreae]
MRVTFPFLYSATSIENGQPVVGHRGDWAEIDLPDASDAPRVCTVEGYSPEGVPYLVEVRKLDGQFYRPKLSVRMNDYFPIDDGSDRFNVRNIGEFVPSFFFGNAGNGQTPIADRPDQIIRYIEGAENARAAVTDEKAETLARIEGALANLVVVDGEVWEPCAEPKLFADIFFSPPNVMIGFHEEVRRTPNGIACVMPLDQIHSFTGLLQEASAEASMASGRQERTPGVVEDRKRWTVNDVQLPEITFLDDTLLGDPTEQALEAARLSSRDILGRTDLQGFRRPFILAWLDFRDAIDAAAADRSKDNMEAMFLHWNHATELLEKSLADELPQAYQITGTTTGIQDKEQARS